MIVALLVLIVLILLFGAGVVKGWIANVATMGCGFIAICLALAWLGSFFGKDGFMYVLFALGGIMLLLAIAGHIINGQAQPHPPGHRARRLRRVGPAPFLDHPHRPSRPKSIASGDGTLTTFRFGSAERHGATLGNCTTLETHTR